MPWKFKFAMKCDNCDCLSRHHSSMELARTHSKMNGWLIGNMMGSDVFLCPDCKEKGLPDWWPDETGTRFHWELEERE